MDRSTFIRACAEGGHALKQVVASMARQLGPALLRDAAHAGADPQAAGDLVQQSLLKAWRHCADFRGHAAVQTWLRAILRHAVIDHLRALRPEVPLLDADDEISAEVEATLLDAADDVGGDPLRLAERAETQRLYEACFARFAAEHPQAAAVIRWVAEDGLAIDEVAAILGRSPGATREFVSQCRKKARVYLAPWYAQVRPERRLAA